MVVDWIQGNLFLVKCPKHAGLGFFGKVCPDTCTTTSAADDSFSHRHSPGINSSKSLQSNIAMTGWLENYHSKWKHNFEKLPFFASQRRFFCWVIPDIYKSQINPVTHQHLTEEIISICHSTCQSECQALLRGKKVKEARKLVTWQRRRAKRLGGHAFLKGCLS